MPSNNRTSDILPSKIRRTGVQQDFQPINPVWRYEEIPTAGKSSLWSSASTWWSPSRSLSGSATEKAKKNPFQIKTEGIEWFRTPWNYPGEEHLPKEQVSTRTCQKSVSEEMERINRGLESLQWYKRPNEVVHIKQDGVTENTPTKQMNQAGWWNIPPLKKSTQSGEHH